MAWVPIHDHFMFCIGPAEGLFGFFYFTEKASFKELTFREERVMVARVEAAVVTTVIAVVEGSRLSR